ncbi:MAG: hypothetical protein IPP07_02790 [Holophagales bacterium]|nr:hypothetical protein [Holophagales bacterium]
MRLRFGAALLPALFLALTSHVRADLNDGKPCFTYINPPGNGLRFVCTSTSSQTVEHSEPVAASRGWRTRITARREGEPEIYDRTLESLSQPLGDLFLQVAFADAKRFVEGTGYAAGIPALLSSSTALIHDLPLAPSTTTKTVGTSSTTSAAGAQTICVGNLGDVAQPPPPLPVGSCVLGATPVTLRPLDASVQSPISDRLDDTNTHTRTDHYSALLLNDELTTDHYEIVARPSPCSKSPATGLGPYVYSCSSTSHHDTPHDSIATFEETRGRHKSWRGSKAARSCTT